MSCTVGGFARPIFKRDVGQGCACMCACLCTSICVYVYGCALVHVDNLIPFSLSGMAIHAGWGM